MNVDPSTHTFQIAANYRFGAQNGGGASFAAPDLQLDRLLCRWRLGAGTVVHDLTLLGALELNGIGGEGVFGEASVGYDHDFGSWVAGVMVDARYSGIPSKLDILGGSINGDADYGFDALARVGAKVNESTLAYVIGGYSWQHFDLACLRAGRRHSRLGLERLLGRWRSRNGRVQQHDRRPRISLFAVSRRTDFGSDGFLTTTPSFQTVRIGAKYKFN